jgi:hypothetical protein
MSGFGAFASGLAGGFATGTELSLKRAETLRAAEKWKLEKPVLSLAADRARREAALYGIDPTGNDAATTGAPVTTAQAYQATKGDPAAAAALTDAVGHTVMLGTGPGGAPATADESQKVEQYFLKLADRAMQLNLPDKVVEFSTAANHAGKMYFDNQLDAAVRKSVASGSPDAITKFYNEEINDGGTVTNEKQKDGSYVVKFWKKDGSLASEHSFQNLDAMIAKAASMKDYQSYAGIKAAELKNHFAEMKAQTDAKRAAAAQEQADAAVRRAQAGETSASAAQRRADAEERRASAEEERVRGGGGQSVTDAARWNADLKADRVTRAQFDAHFAQERAKTESGWRKEATAAYNAAATANTIPKDAKGKTQSIEDFTKEYVKARRAEAGPEAKPAADKGAGGSLPAAALAKLKQGIVTQFGNGTTWTLINGKPVQLNKPRPAGQPPTEQAAPLQ